MSDLVFGFFHPTGSNSEINTNVNSGTKTAFRNGSPACQRDYLLSDLVRQTHASCPQGLERDANGLVDRTERSTPGCTRACEGQPGVTRDIVVRCVSPSAAQSVTQTVTRLNQAPATPVETLAKYSTGADARDRHRWRWPSRRRYAKVGEMSGNCCRTPDGSGGGILMSAVAPSQPTIPAPDPGWIPSPLYRLTVDEYEAMVGSAPWNRATGSISSTGTWWPR